VAAVDFNTVKYAIFGTNSPSKIYAGNVLVWDIDAGGMNPPQNISATFDPPGTYSVWIVWDAPSVDQGVTIEKYFLEYMKDDSTPEFLGYAPSNSFEFTLDQQFPSGTYWFGVRAITNLGTGPVGYSNALVKS